MDKNITMNKPTPRYPDGVLLDLVGLIYDAAGDVGKWQAFMEAAAATFHSGKGHLLSYNGDARKLFLNFSIYLGLTPEEMEAYISFLASRPEIPLEKLDLRVAASLAHRGQAWSCNMLPNRGAFERSDLYRIVLHPGGCDYSLGIFVPHEPPCHSVMGIMRDSSRGPYDAEDVAALNKLAPHFNRAIKLQQQLLEIDLYKRSALDALNLLPIGIVIVNAQANVLFANRTAQLLGDEEGGINLQGDRVWANQPRQTAEIREKISEVVASAETGKLLPGWSVALKRAQPRRPLSLTISPLWGNHLKSNLGFLKQPYAILFISDPDRAQETHVELFQRLYGLTLAEATVLKHLCDDMKPQQIADCLHVSITTVRTHLSNLFAKTSTSRQPELIRLALASQPQAAF